LDNFISNKNTDDIMYTGKVSFEYSTPSDYISILPLGDLHYGSTLCDFDAFKRAVKVLDNENTYWCLMGDVIDSIVITDPRFDYRNSSLGDIILDHADTIVDCLLPYKDTCIGVLTGNHEDKLRQKCQIDISRYIAKQLGAAYMGMTALLYLSFKRSTHYESYTMFLVHGGANVSTRQGRVRKLEELAQIADADIYLQAHFHDLISTKSVTFGVNKAGKLVTKEKTFVVTGGYLRAYENGDSSYVERKLLKPLIIGSPLVQIYPEQSRVEVIQNVL